MSVFTNEEHELVRDMTAAMEKVEELFDAPALCQEQPRPELAVGRFMQVSGIIGGTLRHIDPARYGNPDGPADLPFQLTIIPVSAAMLIEAPHLYPKMVTYIRGRAG